MSLGAGAFVLVARRRFFKLTAAGIVGVSLAESPLPDAARAQEDTEPGQSVEQEFQRAANRYRVPVSVLLAMGYVNTRLHMPPPEATAYRHSDPERRGTYGSMALVRNPSSDTLGAASRLSGVPEQRLMTERAANIEGGAALLASSQGQQRPDKPDQWLGAVAGSGGSGPSYRAIAGVGGGELYAEQVAAVLADGFSVRLESGERITLTGRSGSR